MNNKLQTSENEFEVMNVTVKFNELPKELQQYFRAVIYNKTDCYKWTGKCDWDKLDNSKIGLQVYKDYYKCIAVYYPSQDGFYSSVGIGKLCYNGKSDLETYTNVIHELSIIESQFDNILTNKQVIHDYDYEQLMDAIESGDFETADDIIGDRDLFELI